MQVVAEMAITRSKEADTPSIRFSYRDPATCPAIDRFTPGDNPCFLGVNRWKHVARGIPAQPFAGTPQQAKQVESRRMRYGDTHIEERASSVVADEQSVVFGETQPQFVMNRRPVNRIRLPLP